MSNESVISKMENGGKHYDEEENSNRYGTDMLYVMSAVFYEDDEGRDNGGHAVDDQQPGRKAYMPGKR